MEIFKNKLDFTDWSKSKINEDPSIYYDNFIKEFTDIHNSCFPLKKVKFKSKSIKPWVTKGILNSINGKNLLYKTYIKSPNIANKNCKQILQTKRSLLHTETNRMTR